MKTKQKQSPGGVLSKSVHRKAFARVPLLIKFQAEDCAIYDFQLEL